MKELTTGLDRSLCPLRATLFSNVSIIKYKCICDAYSKISKSFKMQLFLMLDVFKVNTDKNSAFYYISNTT